MQVSSALVNQNVPQRSLLQRTGIIIPTLNASKFFEKLLPILNRQGVDSSQILVVDSSSDDNTVQRAEDFGARVEVISRAEFDHGGTRRDGAALLADFEFLVYLTQDAMLSSSNAVQELVSAFADPKVGLCYGRQLPRPDAKGIERHARLFNYTATSAVRSIDDRKTLGIKTLFCSNSFAAYRRSALEAVGNFPNGVLFAEDQIVAGKMLLAGWKLAYQANACAFHSHDYSISEEFKRYFDVGAFHARNRWILDSFGHAEGEGFKFVKSELKYLLANEPLSIPSALVRTIAKYTAYKAGKYEAKLSSKLKTRLSMHPNYWRRTT